MNALRTTLSCVLVVRPLTYSILSKLLVTVSGESSPAFPGLGRVRVFRPFMKRLDSSPDSSPTSRVRNWERKDSHLKNRSIKPEKMTNLDLILDFLAAKIFLKLKNKSPKDSSPWLKTRIFSFSLENCQKTRILGLESEDSTHH
jgi:hypothetical protein